LQQESQASDPEPGTRSWSVVNSYWPLVDRAALVGLTQDRSYKKTKAVKARPRTVASKIRKLL